jgi:hypothetical protein
MQYNLLVTDETRTAVRALTEFEHFSIEAKLDGPLILRDLSIDARAGEQVDIITEMASDLIVYRNKEKLFRGRITYSQDGFGPDRHTATISTVDYRAILDRRILYTNLNYTGVDQSTIAWNLINYTQGLSGGNLGITRGTGQSTGITRDRPYEAGQNVGELIQQLSEVINGFEYEVDADLKFNVFYPQRGSAKDVVLEYGKDVVVGSRTVSSQDFANAIRMNGEDETIVATRTTANIGTTPEGRWDKQIGINDIKLQTTLNQKADQELITSGELRPSYSLELHDGVWKNKGHFWIGDTVLVVIKSGRLNIVQQMRVLELKLTVNSDSSETVHITVGALPPNLKRRIKSYETRLTELERY